MPRLTERTSCCTQAKTPVPAHRGVWKPLNVSRVCNVREACLIAVSEFCVGELLEFLFFLHRHDVVTPSWFKALESYVLRVPDGNDKKLWSSPYHLCWSLLFFSDLCLI